MVLYLKMLVTVLLCCAVGNSAEKVMALATNREPDLKSRGAVVSKKTDRDYASFAIAWSKTFNGPGVIDKTYIQIMRYISDVACLCSCI